MPNQPKYFGVKPQHIGSYTLGLESIADIHTDVYEVLHKNHWAETEVAYLKRPLVPDYDKLILLEQCGNFLIYTIRDADKQLVGNLMFYIAGSTHCKGILQATEDAFYLLPHVRKGRLAYRLVTFAEEHLKSIGVGLIGLSDKSPCGGKPLGKFMELLGYSPVSVSYIKEV